MYSFVKNTNQTIPHHNLLSRRNYYDLHGLLNDIISLNEISRCTVMKHDNPASIKLVIITMS